MIELIIAFLISIGWLSPVEKKQISITDNNNMTYGIVITDDIQQSTATVIYDDQTGTFKIQK